MLHSLAATDGQNSVWCPDLPCKTVRIFLPQQRKSCTYSCVSTWGSWVCEAHKIPVWVFMCIFFFFLRWMFLYHFHKWECQTSSFMSCFPIPLSSASFSFFSLRSGQVRFQVSSKITIVIYLGELRVEACQKFYLRVVCDILCNEGGFILLCYNACVLAFEKKIIIIALPTYISHKTLYLNKLMHIDIRGAGVWHHFLI